MTTDLYYLGLVALATALMWVPYTLDLIVGQGLMTGLGNRHDVRPLSPWAERAKRAHENAVGNLGIFAALVLAIHLAGAASAATATAALVYFWMRIAHYVVYTLGIIGVRTLVFAVSWGCQIFLALQIVRAPAGFGA